MVLRILNISQRHFLVLSNRGNRVASNDLKHDNTRKQEIDQKPTYNSTYNYGTPHPTSNIPSVKFIVRHNEMKKEKAFREHKQDLMDWHHSFWLQQNEKFNQEKKKYLQRRECKNTIVDGKEQADDLSKEQADDLSLFYKEFLDKNFNIHFKYQREWYKRNFILLWYGLQADIEKFVKRWSGKITRSKTGS